jgi:hypothetical protein
MIVVETPRFARGDTGTYIWTTTKDLAMAHRRQYKPNLLKELFYAAAGLTLLWIIVVASNLSGRFEAIPPETDSMIPALCLRETGAARRHAFFKTLTRFPPFEKIARHLLETSGYEVGID